MSSLVLCVREPPTAEEGLWWEESLLLEPLQEREVEDYGIVHLLQH